ncbi:diacylglycerol/lipid kinase family protein [Swaminathania salitolerans]|uniref:Diacylglycerol kinase n=1 Tax=Swaminathania salitolerans TaxID=182838 RepID=A0A511BRX4_9PROT|nr:diacylglycerol kinase family protein [Swaminathania salitolerans]GEL03087.1 diacylglycerol kinase [Swaminathania salitolerans]
MRFALIHNPRSRRNRRDGRTFARQARRLLGDAFLVPSSHDQMSAMVADLARRDVHVIAINGGDGTVSDVMTAIAHAYRPDALPELAIFPSGNTNLIAQDLGFSRRGIDALLQLYRQGETLPRTRRRPLQVTWPNAGSAPRLGMFQGSTGYARAIAIAHSPHVLRYAPHNLAVGVTLIGAFGSLLWKRQRETWLRGDALTIELEDGSTIGGNSFLFLSTALQKLNLGIWPFWNTGAARSDGVHFLNVADHPRRLIRATLALLRGRAPEWLREAPDYASGRAGRMILTCASDFVIDGERFSPGGDGRIVLSEGPEFGFIHD